MKIGKQLAKMDAVPQFVSGEGPSNVDVYYELADLCTMGAFSGLKLDEPGVDEKLVEPFQNATDLAIRFMNAAEAFLAAVTKADGWEVR